MNKSIFNTSFKHRDVNFFQKFITAEFTQSFGSKHSTFLQEYVRALKATGSTISTFEGINKMRRCYNLIKLLQLSSKLNGSIVECGVYKGATARLMYAYCKIFGNQNSFLLFDTFRGLPGHTQKDAYKDNTGKSSVRFKPNNYSGVSVSDVSRLFRGSSVCIVEGDIADTLATYSKEKFSFVHIDVDLYESTKAALMFFVPRMVRGGILLCDDYLTPVYPGAKQAWDEYFEKHKLSFITLDNYQSAYRKG